MLCQGVHRTTYHRRDWVRLRCPNCGQEWDACNEVDSSCNVNEYVTSTGDDAGKCPECGYAWPEEVGD
uniref:Uncharacterized protein n=1 Tax=viral metagenome TaxID=1070528 RepID=A0A6M3LPZ0_9ZZZZ